MAVCTGITAALGYPYSPHHALLPFIMFGIGGCLFFPLPEKIGRRKTALIFSTGHFLAMGMILFSSGFLVRTIGFGLMGLLNATKNGNCYAWGFDFHLQKDKAFAATCCNIPDFASAFIVGIYFLFISKDWAPLFMYI